MPLPLQVTQKSYISTSRVPQDAKRATYASTHIDLPKRGSDKV